MDLGPFLRDLRENHAKMRAADVSEALSVPKPTLYYWESAKGRPDPVQIRRLCELYAATPEQLARALLLRAQDPVTKDEDPDAVDTVTDAA